MSSQAFYNLDSNYLDTSGNGKDASPVGAGATFLIKNPKALVGNAVAQGFSDANYISCPVTVFDSMTGTGTIKFSFFQRNGDIGRVLIGSTHSGGRGDMFCLVANPLSFRIPTSVGSQNITGGNWRAGRWYRVYMNYSLAGFQVWLEDVAGGSAQLVVNQTPLAAGVPDFGGCTNLFLGRAANIAGFSFSGVIDNVEFDDTLYHVDPQVTNPTLLFLGRGHSFVQGFGSSDGNGYRKAAYELWRDFYERSNYLSGDLINGNIITPFNGGVNGNKAANIDSTIDALLDTIYPIPGPNHTVLLGPIEYTDKNAGTPLASFNASMDSVVSKINAHSSDIKIFIITGPATPLDISAYVAEIKTVYTDALASGKNVFLIDLNTQPIQISADNIHPTDDGYIDMGIYIAEQVEALLNPVAAPPDPPTNLAVASISRTQARVTWTDSVGADYYRVYFNDVNNFGTSIVGAFVAQGDQAAVISGLIASTQYWFWVVAETDSGLLSSEAGPVTVTMPAPASDELVISDIQDALYNWAVSVIAAAGSAATVIWEFGDGPRPTPPFVVLNLIGPRMTGGSDYQSDTGVGGQEFIQQGMREFTVSVNTYADNDSLTLATKLNSSLNNQLFYGALSENKIGVGTVNQIQDLSEFLETEWERRSQFDFIIFAALNEEYISPIIDQVDYNNNILP